MNTKLLAIFAVVFAASMITSMSVYAQQNGLVKPTNTTNTTPNNLLFGCKDGVVLFTNGTGVNMGCVVAPFSFKAFNGVDIKTFNQSTTPINVPTIHVDVQKICLDAKISKKICDKLPKSVP